MSEQQPEVKPEIEDEPEDCYEYCYEYCIECGDAIWEDCYYCNGCLRYLNDHGEHGESDDWEY
jgi:hypothetical protein